MAVPAAAAVIEGNLALAFHERASLGVALDASRALDPAQAAQRLVNDRLGTWTGTSIEFVNVQHRIGVALNDPGVAVAPAEARQLLRVTTTAELGGGPIGEASVLAPRTLVYTCAAGFLSCNTNTVVSSFALTAPVATLGAPAQALGALRIQAAAAQTEVLFEGTTLRLGAVPLPPATVPIGFDQSYQELQGTVRLRASYTTKSLGGYVADALAATDGPAWSAHLAAAAGDIGTLRGASLQAFTPLAGTTPVAAVDTLRDAHASLAAARDAAAWQALGAAPGGALATRSTLVADLWNLTAMANPGLGRGLAGFTDETTFFSSIATEVAAVRAALGASTAGGFTDLLAHHTGAGIAAAGSAPLFTLDGSAYGLDDALLQVFYTAGDSEGGRFEIDLPDATRHALWKPSAVDRFELLSGPVDGMEVADFGLMMAGDGGLYVGESNALRALSGGAAKLALNNLYSPATIVVASWGVAAPVPEPRAALLLAAGLALLAWRRRAVRAGTAGQGAAGG